MAQSWESKAIQAAGRRWTEAYKNNDKRGMAKAAAEAARLRTAQGYKLEGGTARSIPLVKNQQRFQDMKTDGIIFGIGAKTAEQRYNPYKHVEDVINESVRPKPKTQWQNSQRPNSYYSSPSMNIKERPSTHKILTEGLKYNVDNSAATRGYIGFLDGYVPINIDQGLRNRLGDERVSKMQDSTSYKVGEVGGTVGQYASVYGLGAAAGLGKAVTSLPKVSRMGRFGQGLARSAAFDLTLGTPLNTLNSISHGYRGKDLVKQVGQMGAIDLALGSAFEIAGAGFRGARQAMANRAASQIPVLQPNGSIKVMTVPRSAAEAVASNPLQRFHVGSEANASVSQRARAATAQREAINRAGVRKEIGSEALPNSIDEKSAALVEGIRKWSGVEVRFADLPSGVNGTYRSGVITVSKDAPYPAVQVIKHELTHHMESSGLYEPFSKFIISNAEKSGVDVGKTMEQIAFDYADMGKKLTPDEINKEFVAKYSEEYLFADERSIHRLARENPNLFTKIYDWIQDMLRKFSPGTDAEGRFLIEAQRQYEKALRSVKEVKKRDVQYLFAGKNAQNADLEALRRAESMERQGAAQESIWKETGWWRGADEKWRFEIDDSQMVFHSDGHANVKDLRGFQRQKELAAKSAVGTITPREQLELRNLTNIYKKTPSSKVEEYIEHDKLFEAYPEIKNVGFRFGDIQEDGVHDHTGITLNRNLKDEEHAGIALHELQHRIQRIEGFQHGGDPQSALDVVRDKARKYLRAVKDRGYLVVEKSGDVEDMLRYVDSFLLKQYNADNIDDVARQAYLGLLGEQEARNVMARMNLAATQRAEAMPRYDKGAIMRGDMENVPKESLGRRIGEEERRRIFRAGIPAERGIDILRNHVGGGYGISRRFRGVGQEGLDDFRTSSEGGNLKRNYIHMTPAAPKARTGTSDEDLRQIIDASFSETNGGAYMLQHVRDSALKRLIAENDPMARKLLENGDAQGVIRRVDDYILRSYFEPERKAAVRTAYERLR